MPHRAVPELAATGRHTRAGSVNRAAFGSQGTIQRGDHEGDSPRRIQHLMTSEFL